jgi:quercetin dioxygenase-like cupin family protein
MPNITVAAAKTAVAGSPDYFTGNVQLETLISVADPSRLAGVRVTFEPGARTAWHTHPLGQTLIVIGGTGWIQEWGGNVEGFREGDVVRIAPGVKHWHGATPSSQTIHIALQEQLDGRTTDWMEKVTDEEYHSA